MNRFEFSFERLHVHVDFPTDEKSTRSARLLIIDKVRDKGMEPIFPAQIPQDP